MRVGAAVLAAVMAVALTGCGLTVPTDPEGTLDRITGGELRVGASPSAGLVATIGEGADVEVSGPLPALIEGFAAEREARIAWTVGGEEELVDGLEAGDLDLVIGGITDATPWVDRASVTRGYPGLPGADGRSIVLLLPLGENALQSALETFLDGEVK